MSSFVRDSVPRPYGAACDIGAFEYADIIFKNGFQAHKKKMGTEVLSRFNYLRPLVL